MDLTQVAKTMTESLGLATIPIGLAFLEQPPAGVPRYGQAVPSACSFWKAAQTSLFYATAEDHYNCPIGAITQGFKPPASVMEQAMQLIGTMGKLQYFDAAEVGNVPSVEKPHQVVVYGPLAAFGPANPPDLALIICKPFQAMLLAEATGASAWQGAGKETHVFGRPACAVIPSALKADAPAASLGCMGARTFASIEEDAMLLAVPIKAVASLEALQTLRANAAMRDFYKERKGQFAAV